MTTTKSGGANPRVSLHDDAAAGRLYGSRVAASRTDTHPFAQPRRARHRWLRWGAVVATGSLAACAVGPDYHRPDVALTPSFMQSPALAPEDGASTQRWWHAFGDVDLDRIMERVMEQNLDLAQAQARIEQARAMAQRTGAARLPKVEAAASASTQRASIESPLGRIADGLGAPRAYEDYGLGAQASWELDLFGGLRREQEAAGAEAQAAEVGSAAVRISIQAEAADAYLALRGYQARLSLARSQQSTQEKLVDLIQQRFDKGVSADRELQRAIGERERVRATIPPLVAQIDAQLNRLDVLMGTQPGTYRSELERFTAQPVAPNPAASAAPGELLRHRPDVVAAERRLAAANARIGAAIAGYYPRVSLGGSAGFDATQSGSVFTSDGFQVQGVVGLRWRLFDFGRVDAEVAQARGREAELLAAYRASVLRASEDVENALSHLVQARLQSTILERQIAALTSARDQAELAYRGGVLALIEVLDADRELLAASDQLATTRAESARAAVASYRALGGGWPG